MHRLKVISRENSLWVKSYLQRHMFILFVTVSLVAKKKNDRLYRYMLCCQGNSRYACTPHQILLVCLCMICISVINKIYEDIPFQPPVLRNYPHRFQGLWYIHLLAMVATMVLPNRIQFYLLPCMQCVQQCNDHSLPICLH